MMASLAYLLYEVAVILLLCAGGLLAAWLVLQGRLTIPRILIIILLCYATMMGVLTVFQCSFYDDTGRCIDTGHSLLRNLVAVHSKLLAVVAAIVSASLAAFYFRRKDLKAILLKGQIRCPIHKIP